MSNVVPRRYRDVSVAEVDRPLDPASLRDHLLGRDSYRRTRFIIARHGDQTAVVRVERATDEPLFSPITGVEVLALPHECALLRLPDVDTAVPSQLAAAAVGLAPEARCVVVHGRYEHLSFILDPQPLRVTVVEVVPPEPPKLLDQCRRVLETADELPPIELVPQLVDLRELGARDRDGRGRLLPCRGSGVTLDGTEVAYLDQHPERRDWLLLGCARSREIHRWFYGDDADSVDICPRRIDAPAPVLTKCCLLEEHLEVTPGRVTVPWGASLDLVRGGLREVARIAEPAWAPA
ncbi:MAG TPA: hypothetical protein VMU20_12080 [Candidatus Dormibacteraeota bacterium]|nr:hypothetical protein [Candidatus Dormibacteraeota bacterium]